MRLFAEFPQPRILTTDYIYIPSETTRVMFIRVSDFADIPKQSQGQLIFALMDRYTDKNPRNAVFYSGPDSLRKEKPVILSRERLSNIWKFMFPTQKNSSKEELLIRIIQEIDDEDEFTLGIFGERKKDNQVVLHRGMALELELNGNYIKNYTFKVFKGKREDLQLTEPTIQQLFSKFDLIINIEKEVIEQKRDLLNAVLEKLTPSEQERRKWKANIDRLDSQILEPFEMNFYLFSHSNFYNDCADFVIALIKNKYKKEERTLELINFFSLLERTKIRKTPLYSLHDLVRKKHKGYGKATQDGIISHVASAASTTTSSSAASAAPSPRGECGVGYGSKTPRLFPSDSEGDKGEAEEKKAETQHQEGLADDSTSPDFAF